MFNMDEDMQIYKNIYHEFVSMSYCARQYLNVVVHAEAESQPQLWWWNAIIQGEMGTRTLKIREFVVVCVDKFSTMSNGETSILFFR